MICVRLRDGIRVKRVGFYCIRARSQHFLMDVKDEIGPGHREDLVVAHQHLGVDADVQLLQYSLRDRIAFAPPESRQIEVRRTGPIP